MAEKKGAHRGEQSDEAREAVDRIFKNLLKSQFPLAPDPEPDIGLVNLKNKRRLAKDRH